jgi:hypothetical protein
MLVPSAGLLPPPRWARGPLSVPCRLGTPAYKLQVKTKSGACNHTSPHTPQHWNLPPDRRGLRGCHMSSGSGARLPVREGSSTAMCTMASDPQGGLWPIMYHVASDPASLRDQEAFGSQLLVPPRAPNPKSGPDSQRCPRDQRIKRLPGPRS